MSTHKHAIVRNATSTGVVTDPDLNVYAKAADLKALADRVTALEATVVVPPPVIVPPPVPLPPVIVPTYTPVPNAGLVAALSAAAAGATLYLDGDYPIGAIADWGNTDLKVMPVPGKTARIVATTQSTLLYGGWHKPCLRCVISGVSIVGADILQDDSNGSSLVGFGPLAADSFYDGCTLLGSPAWTGNTQHACYFFGDGSANVGHGNGLRNCVVDGRGMKADLITFYHPTAAKGAIIRGCAIKNGHIGVQLWDHLSTGIVIDTNTFDGLDIGVRHHASSGTSVTGNIFTASVGTKWLVDGDAAACTIGAGQ